MATKHTDASVVVLTGPTRAGKSTVCRAVIDATRARSLTVTGVLTEDGAQPDGSRLQFALDLRTGERRLLAVARGATPRRDPLAHAPRAGWSFEDDGVAFGREVLGACLRDPGDLLVVDQLGPLELREGGGWRAAFDVIAGRRYGLALVVVNPRVLDEAAALIGSCRVHEVNGETRDALPAAIVAEHLPRGS